MDGQPLTTPGLDHKFRINSVRWRWVKSRECVGPVDNKVQFTSVITRVPTRAQAGITALNRTSPLPPWTGDATAFSYPAHMMLYWSFIYGPAAAATRYSSCVM